MESIPESPESKSRTNDNELRATEMMLKTICKTNTYRFKRYENCLQASEAIEFLIRNNFATSKAAAIEFGNSLVKKGYIEHVAERTTPFSDAYGYFQVPIKYHDFMFGIMPTGTQLLSLTSISASPNSSPTP